MMEGQTTRWSQMRVVTVWQHLPQPTTHAFTASLRVSMHSSVTSLLTSFISACRVQANADIFACGGFSVMISQTHLDNDNSREMHRICFQIAENTSMPFGHREN